MTSGFVLGPGEGSAYGFHGSVAVIKASGEGPVWRGENAQYPERAWFHALVTTRGTLRPELPRIGV